MFRWPRVVAASLGFIWFLQIGGGPTLNPANVAWLLSGDSLQHWLGWLMFRHEPWTFPFGAITAMPYPLGTTVGFTDSNPLVSLLLKPFSSLLPAEFQFIGLWLALCFVLQGYAGAALAGVVTKDPVQQALGGYLFVLSPVLLGRIGHDTLCAHWLLLGLLYFGLREYADTRQAQRGAWIGMSLVMIAAAIHPYLMAMSWVLAIAWYVRLRWSRVMTTRWVFGAASATTAGMLGVLAILGYFGHSQWSAGGFGLYQSDLLTLVNPGGVSHVLPGLPLDPRSQYEGRGFVGLGGLVALAVAAAALTRRRPSLAGGKAVVVASCVLMGFFALSSDVTLAGRTILNLNWLYEPVESLTGPFRSSGRFVWPLHYLVLLMGIWGAIRVFGAGSTAPSTALLFVIVIVQAADTKPEGPWSSPKKFRQAPVADFTLAAGRYRHLALFPMQVQGACGDPYEEDHVYRFMLHAYRLRMSYNSGNFARLDAHEAQEACAGLERAVFTGALDSGTIYVVSPGHVARFAAVGASCGRFDGDWICVSKDSDTRFRTYIDTGR